MKQNRRSSNATSDGSSPNAVRLGTMLPKPTEKLAVCEEQDNESENFEFNPNRISDNANDEAIENFLSGNPGAFAKPQEPPAKKTPEPKEEAEISGGGGFNMTRWHD